MKDGNMNINGLQKLANAVIVQAVRDYRSAENNDSRREIEKFFRSEYFKLFTDVDGEYLIRKLRAEVMHD